MSERKCGFFVPNDPDLATTTDNYAFKFIPVEYLDRAIQKVRRGKQLQQQRSTEKIEPEMHRNDCPHRLQTCQTHTTMATEQQQLKPVIEYQEQEGQQGVRDLSKQEVENLIRKAKTRPAPKTGQTLLHNQTPRENTQEPIECGRVNLQDVRSFCNDNPNQLSVRGESGKEMQSLREEFHSTYTSQARSSKTLIRSHVSNERRVIRQYAQDETWVQNEREVCTPRLIHHGSHTARESVVSASSSPLPSQRSLKNPQIYIAHENMVYNSNISPVLSPKPDLVSTGTSPISSPKRGTSDNSSETFVQNKTYQIEHFEEVKSQVAQITDKVKLEACLKPEAKWVEIIEANKENRIEKEVQGNPLYLRRLKPSSKAATTHGTEMYTKYTNVQNLCDNSIEMQNQLPTFLMTEIIKDNVRHSGGSINVSPHANLYQGVVERVELEDSETELEIMDGPHLSINVTPKHMEEGQKALSTDRSGGRGELDEFLEIERGINEMDNDSYREDTSPLSFTDMAVIDTVKKVVISNKKNQSPRISTNESVKDPCSLLISDLSRNTSPVPTKKTRRRSKSLREQHLQETFERLATGGRSRNRTRDYSPFPSAVNNVTTNRAPSAQSPHCCGRTRTSLSTSPIAQRLNLGSYTDRGDCKAREKSLKSRRRVNTWQPLKISQSLEDLKSEKTKIFNKMANIQVKILDVMEQLRHVLMDLKIPKNVAEKSKRQKTALEFAVRISRNFLSPLKGMLDELQRTPNEQFTSLSSNEACHRVSYIYNLVLQSLTTYQKQLRFVHVDPVPQKLPTLIEFIHAATVLCLEKRIFSRHDERIALLQQSCNSFLDFLQRLQSGNLIEERETYRKLTLDKASPKYELKMVMNPLNMYEPKLVPKPTTPVNTSRKKPKNKRHLTAVPMEEAKDEIEEKPKDDLIPTQVRSLNVDAKSSNEMQTSSQPSLNSGSGDFLNPIIDKSVLEAMRLMTQDQVRQILDPIMQSLSTAIGYQNNPEVFEAIFSAVNSKVFCPMVDEKQLSTDNKCLPNEQTAPTTKAPTPSGKETALRTQFVANAESTSKPLEVANQTKMQSQQISRTKILAASRKHSAPAITTASTMSSVASTVANAAVAASTTAIGDVGDNCPTVYRQSSGNRKNNNRNNNNKKSSSCLTLHSDHSSCPVWRRGSDGELTHKPNGEELTVITNKEESQRLNKSFKIMNEVVVNDEYEYTNYHKRQQQHQQQQQQQRQQQQQQQYAKSPIQKTSKKAPKQERDRVCDRVVRRCKQQRPTNKMPCSGRSSSTTTTAADSTDSFDSDNEATKFKGKNPTPLNLNKHKQTRLHGRQLSISNIRTSHKVEGHSSSPCVLQSASSKRNLKKSISGKKRIQEEDCNMVKPNTPPTFSRDVILSDESDESLDRMLLRKMSKSLLDIPIPLTSASVLHACGDNGSVNDNEIHDPKADRSAYAADRSESLTLCTKDSPYGDPFLNMPQKPRPLSKKELQNQRLRANQMNRQKCSEKVLENEKQYHTAMNSEEPKSSYLNIDEMMQLRNQFLKLCEKNRFYKNPNFEEPWNIFTIISERLLNDILDTVEHDFNEGVAKFVEDFLELETKTQ